MNRYTAPLECLDKLCEPATLDARGLVGVIVGLVGIWLIACVIRGK